MTDQLNYSDSLKKTKEYGVAFAISHPIVFVEGLPSVKLREIVIFENGQKGEVFAISKGKVEIRVFSHIPIQVGMKVTRTNTTISVPAGRELLGQTVNPLGEPLDSQKKFKMPKELRDLESTPVPISGRHNIATPMVTGVVLIDMMIPLGRGQRELVIGDKKTGKTAMLLTTIKQQVSEGVVAIYAAIAKKKSEIKKLQVFFESEKIADKVILIATSSYDSPSLIYQTPYSAMAVAEYFRDQGQNTIVILDDLSTHAKFYRELSLLARRFPGRDSYPGDIFYTHSRLLERGGNFNHPTAGEVSITCIPVIEIVEGDLTGYVPTNVMGITDGHIYLDSDIFFQGQRPAVNIPLSVTRVGRQTLDKLSREINKELGQFLTRYEKLKNLSHFGQELTSEVKNALRLGEIITKFFNQPYQETVPKPIQQVILIMVMENIIMDKTSLFQVKEGMIKAYGEEENKKYFLSLTSVKDLKTFSAKIDEEKDKLMSFAAKTP